ncbi:outer membrane immunogenic protein [Bradyrhizobium lablabi]|nr:outer membrane immunogenic protein [Bradyrhizobium lablabi]
MAVAGSANAADLKLKAPPLAEAPIAYSWSGFYLGGNVGVIWNNTSADPGSFTTTGVDFAGRQAVGQFPSFNTGNTGFTGGVQTGYNWQFAPNWVAGIEADLDYAGLNKTDTRVFAATHFIGDGPIEANTESAQQRLSWLGTVRGRLGFTVLDNRLLAFATGGFAYGKVDDSIQTIGVPNGAAGVLVRASSDTVRTGWTAGGGVEYAFPNNWSAKLEYLYYDLGSRILNLNYGTVPGDAGNTLNYKFHDNGNLVRVGLNHRF